MTVLTKVSLAVAVMAVGFAPVAMAELSPEEQIQYRQAGYSFMSWNMQKIKANLDGDYSQPQVAAAANAIAGIANSGMGALFGPGTDKDIGDVTTRVKPEFFQNMDEVGAIARDYIAAADELAETAAMDDKESVRAAFGALGKTCKSCHDKFRKD